MKKDLKLFLSLLLCTVLFSGCYPSGSRSQPEKISSSSSGASQSGNAEIQSTNENLTFSFNLSEKFPTEAPSIKVKPRFWDNEKIKNLFLTGKNITKEAERQSDLFPEEKGYYYYADDVNFSLNFEPMFISANYYDIQSQFINFDLVRHSEKGISLEKTLIESELTDFSRADAVKRVDEILNALEITNIGEPKVFTFTADAANSFIENDVFYDKDGNAHAVEKLTKNDEFYLIEYSLVFEGLHTSRHFVPIFGTAERDFKFPIIRATVTKDKIVNFECQYIYSDKYEIVENVPIKFSQTDAVNALNEYYTGKILSSPIEFYNADLVYTAQNDWDNGYTLVPAWDFTGFENIDMNDGKTHYASYYKNVSVENGMIYEYLY